MSIRLTRRAGEPEEMDDFTQGGAELEEALRHLRRLNRLFGASGPALYGVKRLWESAGRPRRLSVLDVGAGSGDINRRLLKWADRQGVELKVTLSDVTEEAETEAGRLFRGEPRVSFLRRNVFDLPANAADLVTASQFAHHFPPDRLPSLLNRLLDIARVGVVVNDLHRHWMSWTAVWLATRLVSGNRYIRHDGPLSVAKGFRAADFRELAGSLEGTSLHASWRPLFRYAVVLAKEREGRA